MNNKSDKLTTGIDGLDKLFFGGIHVETDANSKDRKDNSDSSNLIVAIRGNRGVKKFYLGLPLCKALCENIERVGKKKTVKPSLIFSLSKTNEHLLNIFCNIYIQGLIHKIQIESDYLKIYRKLLKDCDCINEEGNTGCIKFHKVIIEKLRFISEDKFCEINDEFICTAIRDGLLYYNERTQYFHIRRPKRNDDTDQTKMFKIDAKKLAKKHQMFFYGKDKMLNKEEPSNNLVLFHRLIHVLNDEDKPHKFYGCILIDGLSRLTDKDMEQCPFDALVDILHNNCRVGIISMDERLPISSINPDIVLEMRTRRDEKYNFTCRELCISKCLHQQNAYGWHAYKLRNYGIEVIPSVHKLLYRRNYMDNAIPEALLPINKPSYRYWIEESVVDETTINDISDSETNENSIRKLCDNYRNYKTTDNAIDLYDKIVQGGVWGFSRKNNDDELITDILSDIYSNEIKEKDHHALFIDFSRSRKDFWNIINKSKYKDCSDNIHFFRIRYGCVFSDELLYIIEQQVDALAKHIRRDDTRPLYCWYNKIHVIMGDMKYLEFGHPRLFDDELFLPAYVDLTKGNYMKNYLYMSGESERLKAMMKYVADN